jgi:hypothetical protein
MVVNKTKKMLKPEEAWIAPLIHFNSCVLYTLQLKCRIIADPVKN